MYANAKLIRVADTTVDGATVEPLSLASAKNYLRVDIDDDDEFISDAIVAARMFAEMHIERSFVTTRWRLTLDNFTDSTDVAPHLALPYLSWLAPGGKIRLPMPPLIEVTSIQYTSLGGTSEPLDLDNVLVSPGTPGEIAPAYGGFFPFTRPGIGSVQIEYDAGYGTDPAAVPRNVVQAIRMMVANFYEGRSTNVPASDWVVNLLNASAWGHYA